MGNTAFTTSFVCFIIYQNTHTCALNTETHTLYCEFYFAVLFWMNRWSGRVTASRRTDPKRASVTEHSGVDNEQRQVLSCVRTHTDKHAGLRKLVSDLFTLFCLWNRSTHSRGRTSASLSCSTHRLKLSVRLTENLLTGCWASVVWRWELRLCGDGGGVLIS